MSLILPGRIEINRRERDVQPLNTNHKTQTAAGGVTRERQARQLCLYCDFPSAGQAKHCYN